MTPQEKELIQNVANKLKQSPEVKKDADAEQLISQEISAQNDAVYKLTQAVLVQEMALKELKEKNDYLEKAVAHHKEESKRGTLSKMMGGQRPEPQPPQPARQSGAFGSFMQTAASVAVGMVAGNMISNALFGDEPAADMAAAEAEGAMDEGLASAEDAASEGGFLGGDSGFASEYTETSGGFGDSGFGDAGFQEAGFEESGDEGGFFDGGDDFGGFDDEI
ncbi:DUF2076 domain-containing protein [Vibrio sp. Of7-15]|uniref:DUF2076 domain-containing protein n=1 Tax=Vibrio sp. Of7-15 TaxID=2724879 RepID=UPI001EF265D3|nr:DUF2076 family protein [Vibrio sp. Of7-15]MCG7499418.1 DUF2076 domain-containing protein [Vibrio sp. Of7-15]